MDFSTLTFSPPLIWFCVGVIFLIAEMTLPGFILIFFMGGAWITAIAVWMWDINLTLQMVIFLLSSLFLLFILRKYCVKVFQGGATDSADDPCSESKTGKTALVTQKISPPLHGEIKLGGTFWRATAEEEIEEGSIVFIEKQESNDGLLFKVKLKQTNP